MSTPLPHSFVLGQRVLVPRGDNDGTLVEEIPDANNDASYQVIEELRKSAVEQDVERFINVYRTRYINDDSVCNYFRFGDLSPYDDFNSYSLCTCPGKSDEPQRINKYMYTRACSCINGKRYLAYLCAFNRGTHNHYHVKDDTVVTPIKEYLLQDGPIELSYVSAITINRA